MGVALLLSSYFVISRIDLRGRSCAGVAWNFGRFLGEEEGILKGGGKVVVNPPSQSSLHPLLSHQISPYALLLNNQQNSSLFSRNFQKAPTMEQGGTSQTMR